ncbi:MAG: bifunctional glutamate N-acetyltransferase/amino-acid acetyltransferase ArgJ [Hyphomicrobiales bacterium]
MMDNVSPLAPSRYAEMPALKGVGLAVAEAGIKYAGRKDVLLMHFDEPAAVAGVFTTSKCSSAPVDWCKQVLQAGTARAVLINAGNANAFTGVKGWEAVRISAELVSEQVGCPVNQVYLASTGVIGEPLDASVFDGVLGGLHRDLNEKSWLDAAKAIMTTDTFPKVATASVEIDGEIITVNGIAKGSGMIAPDMATMLSFIVTDAPISSELLQKLLTQSADASFNSVTVDSDTSTSDTVLLFATGKASIDPISDSKDKRLRLLAKALHAVSLDLSHQIVRDGEGASKFVEINVLGAKSARAAKNVAKAIANSPLVKTAIAGEDANWGRVVMAVGKAGEEADRDRLAIWFGDVRVAVNGERDPDYSEEAASAVMKNDDIQLVVDLGIGKGKATMWTCDLTKQYVAINGDYRS